MEQRKGRMLPSAPTADPTKLPPPQSTPMRDLNPGGRPVPEGGRSLEEVLEMQKKLLAARGRQSVPEVPQDDLLAPVDFGEDLGDLPVIEVTDKLPSGGLAYPENFKIHYRPYVFGEVEKVSASKISYGELSRIILAGIRTSFPVGDLTYYDFLYLALLRKLSTIGEDSVRATQDCPQCGAPSTYEVHVGAQDSEVEFLPVRYKKLPLLADFQFAGDDAPRAYRFRPITIRQYLELERRGVHTDSLSKLAIQCDTVPFAEARSKFFRAQGQDSQVLSLIKDALFHGVKPINVTCGGCGVQNRLHLDRGEVIIRPFRGDAETLDDRIRFGEEVLHQPGAPG